MTTTRSHQDVTREVKSETTTRVSASMFEARDISQATIPAQELIDASLVEIFLNKIFQDKKFTVDDPVTKEIYFDKTRTYELRFGLMAIGNIPVIIGPHCQTNWQSHPLFFDLDNKLQIVRSELRKSIKDPDKYIVTENHPFDRGFYFNEVTMFAAEIRTLGIVSEVSATVEKDMLDREITHAAKKKEFDSVHDHPASLFFSPNVILDDVRNSAIIHPACFPITKLKS